MIADTDDSDTEIDRILAPTSPRDVASADEGKEEKEVDYSDDDKSIADSQHMTADSHHVKRNHNDCIDAADLRSHNATISQRVDSAFFSSMRISLKTLQSTSRDPLRMAISSRDEIDLQMILDELGPNATKSILSRDSEGCTALHLAALSKSPRIVAMLLNSYRIYESRVLNADLRILNEEYQQTIRKVKEKIDSNDAEQKVSKMSFASQSASLKDWFDKEKARRMRQFEFRNEIWWTKNLCSKDREGRTPLHYVAGSGANADLLEAFVLLGRGRFSEHVPNESDKEHSVKGSRSQNSDRGAKGTIAKNTVPIFHSGTMYDLLSGREMAVYSANSYRGKTPVSELSASADPKSFSSSGYNQNQEAKEYNDNQSYRDVSWNLTGTQTRDSSGIGTQTRDSTGIAGMPTVDYDIIVPWVLRNMLRSSTERGLESSRSSAERLKTLLDSVELSRLGVFLVAELGSVLGGLGIRVTLDILREMCRRYPANMADITEKYEWVEGMQKEEKEKEKEKVDAMKLRQGHGGRGDKGYERTDVQHRADSKGVSMQRSAASSSSSKHSDSDDDYDYDDDYEDGSEGRRDDSKASAKSTTQSLRLQPNKMPPIVYSSLLIDKIDENIGLDVRQLIDDISSGRGLRPIVDDRGADEDESSYMTDSRHSYGICTGSHSRGGGVGSRSTTDYATLPSTLTVAMAVKARCAVINVCDSLGRSPLLVASALGNKGLVASLLSMGGDISIVTPDGHTAFTVAKSPRIRALPERSLLTWMNKREHSSTSSTRSSVDSTIRGRMERSLRNTLSRSDNSISQTVSNIAQGVGHGEGDRLGDGEGEKEREGQTESTLDNQDIIVKNSEDMSITSKISDRGGDREGDREGDMLSRSNMMTVEERARAVAGLIGPLENLKLAKWAYSRPPLLWAVHNGLLSAVRGLLPTRSSSSSSSSFSSCGLSLGATSSQDPNCTDSLGRGALHECAALIRSNREVLVLAAVPIAEALIAAGTNLNSASVSGRTPLHELFCATQDEKVSSYRVSSQGTAAICVTATHTVDAQLVMRCRRQLVRSLLQFGADPLILDRHGLSPMHYCARENHADCFLEILLKGVDGTFQTGLKQTSLHIACKSGALKVAHLLCRWDADHIPTPHKRLNIAQQRDAQGKIPAQLLPSAASSKCLETLWSTCRAGNLSRVSEIICDLKRFEGDGAGAGKALWENVDGTDGTYGTTEGGEGSIGGHQVDVEDYGDGVVVLDRRKIKASMGGSELWLLDGVDSKTWRLRWTPLHSCVIGWAESRGTAQLGEGKGNVNWNQKNKVSKGIGVKRDIPRVGSAACEALGLNSRTASCGVDSVGKSERRRHGEILNLLLKRFAYVDSLDVNCRTALMHAAAYNLSDACAILLDAGAAIETTDLQGNTALHLAYAFGSMTCVLYLEARGGSDFIQNCFGRLPSEEVGRHSLLTPLFSIPVD